jgi:hypothetical protein
VFSRLHLLLRLSTRAMAAELVPVLQSLLSSDNAQRKAAEQQYNQVKAQQPAVAVAALLQVISEPQVQLPVREQSAVLLRQCLSQPTSPNSIWMQLGAGQAEIRARLLQVVGSEEQDQVRRSCRLSAELGKSPYRDR